MDDDLEAISTYGYFGGTAGADAVFTYGWYLEFIVAPADKGIFIEMAGIFEEGVWF